MWQLTLILNALRLLQEQETVLRKRTAAELASAAFDLERFVRCAPKKDAELRRQLSVIALNVLSTEHYMLLSKLNTKKQNQTITQLMGLIQFQS